ncbi:hypothetical protein AB0J38_11465 [Streptomyces sp. NPDC050095]|uniref:hypothetical protein n=1 Tax=unclassified Streptomyces TaxID=2593676 RepID=UPI0034494730
MANTFGQPPSHPGSHLTVETGKTLMPEHEECGRAPVPAMSDVHSMPDKPRDTV